MHSFPVVVEYPVMKCFDDFFERGEGGQVPAFELEFPVIGFLMPVLPRGSLGAHGWAYAVLRKEIQHEEAPVFTSLVTMENLWNALGFSDSILHGFQHEFLRVPKGNRVSGYFSGICIQYRCKVKRHSFPYKVGEICSPYSVRTTGRNVFREIRDSGIRDSYIFALRPSSGFLHESGYRKHLHESSGFPKTPSEGPCDPAMSVPRMFRMYGFEFFVGYLIFLLHHGLVMK